MVSTVMPMYVERKVAHPDPVVIDVAVAVSVVEVWHLVTAL